jgi:hypothetical protein
MQKLLAKIAMTAVLFSLVIIAPKAQAAPLPLWNASGAYVVSFDLGGSHLHDMTLVQDGLGNLTGGGAYPAGGPNVYEWVIDSGTVSGNDINFTAHYTVGADAIAPLTTMVVTGTVAPGGTMSGTWSDNYQGGVRNGTWHTTSGTAAPIVATLAAEDFGVVDYDTGLGILKGYTAGFGLTGATFTGATSVEVKLYAAGDVLLQTNTAIIPQFNLDITGTQFSSPFDVSGTFDYVTDGYWTNVREVQFGQSVPAVKVVATATLQDGTVVTATNTSLTGDPATIFAPADVTAPAMPTHLSPADNAVLTTAAFTMADWTDVTDPSSPVAYYYEVSNSPAINLDGSFVSPTYQSGALAVSDIATPGTPTGVYYWHVRAVDTVNNSSAWTTAWTVTVDNTTPPVVTTPTNKNECKNGGWQTFTNPSFKNQGQCVAFTNHLQ